MFNARCVALTICLLGTVPSLAAAPVPSGAPFHVRYAESVELVRGAKLRLIGVSEGRCAIGMKCVWQGEAQVEIELQVQGQTVRGSITTEKPDLTLLARNAPPR